MVKAYFLSDIHLESEEDSNFFSLQKLLADVEKDGEATHLFLLGDIFDLWVADHDYFKRKFQKTLKALGRIQARGVEVHYFEGNHDLDLKPYFEEKGVRVHEKAFQVQLGEKKIQIEHGDQMDPTDRGYLFLRWLLRTPVMRGVGRSLPGVLVQRIGNSMSSTSRKYTDRLKSDLGKDAAARKTKIFEKIKDHVLREIRKQNDADIFVSGHVHERYRETLNVQGKSVEVVNLGCWLGEEKPYGIYTDQEGFRFGFN